MPLTRLGLALALVPLALWPVQAQSGPCGGLPAPAFCDTFDRVSAPPPPLCAPLAPSGTVPNHTGGTVVTWLQVCQGVPMAGVYAISAFPSTQAFSDLFNAIASPRGRGGDLDSRLWSTGRLAPHDTVQPSNPNWIRAATIPAGIQTGFSSTSVYPPDDMLISNTGAHTGQLMTTSTIQNYGNSSFMIRQPFDFTGRTGRIVVYVDAKSPSAIGYYLQLAITADPIPCPTYLAGGNEETGPIPRMGLVLPFKDGQSGQPINSRINVATAYTYSTYAQTALTATTNLTGTSAPATLDGSLNRIELRISTTLISIYMSDYSPDGITFPNSDRLVWEAPMSLPFSTGYVHLGLRNHASLKFGFATTGVYYWGSAAFDGPVLTVPRAYEIPDNTTTDTITDDVSEGPILVQHLGYRVGDGSSIAEGVWSPTALISPLTFTGSVNLSGATAAKLSLNVFFLSGGSPAITTSSGLKYKLNGGTWRTRLLTADEVTAANTSGAAGLIGLLIDVALGDLQSGTNTIDFSSVSVPSGGYYPMICNIDLLVYALMAWGFVQQATSPTITADPADLAFSADTTVGNTLFCAITFRNAFFGVQTVVITDSGSNVWTQDLRVEVQNDGTNYKYMELWSAPCTTALINGSGHTVHADFNFAPSVAIMGVLEYSGLASASRLDVIASAFGSNTSPASGATAATGAANELVLGGMLLSENGSNNTTFSSSGYTTRAFGTHGFVDLIWVGDKDSGSSAATPSMSGTLSALSGTERWGAFTAVYKLAGGGGGPTAAQISPAMLGPLTSAVIGRVDA